MRKVIIIVFTLLLGVAFFSCKKTSNPTPGPSVITYKDFSVVSETEAYFHFDVKDPDGDIGLKNSDTTGDFAYGSFYYNDFHMQILNYDSNTGNFIPYIIVVPHSPPAQNDSFGIFKFRIPFIDIKSKDKSLTAEVHIKMQGYRPHTGIKRFKYKFFIFDRAHHRSNEVTTPEFNYP